MARLVEIGKAKPNEVAAIRFLAEQLPSSYVMYTNVDLATGKRAGHTYEHDVVVIAPHAVFCVELKAWGGRIEGNRDRWRLDDGLYIQSPLPLIAEKARVLKSQLTAQSRDLRQVWVQGLVFVTAKDAQLNLTRSYEHLARTRGDILPALKDPQVWSLHHRMGKGQLKWVERVLADGEPPRERTHIGQYKLLEKLPAESRTYESWRGEAPFGEKRMLHFYATRGDNDKARRRAHEHALREATLHQRVDGHPDTLKFWGYERLSEPNGVVLTFEDTTELLPLMAWVETFKPSLRNRLRVAARVARALGWVHARDVVHRRLSAAAVLVSAEEAPTKVRLCELELARDLAGRAPTVTRSALDDPSYRSMAPELLRSNDATTASDLYSLGATLFELLAETPLFERAEEALQRDRPIPDVHLDGRAIPAPLSRLVSELLHHEPSERPPDAVSVAATLEELLEEPQPEENRALQPGDCIMDVYELEEHLGEGASGSSWKVRHQIDGSRLVAKIADADQALALQAEAEVLQLVQHDNLVTYRNIYPYDGGQALLLGYVEGVDGRMWAGAGDDLGPTKLVRVAEGLFGALHALHDLGYVHRDIKPENVIFAEPGATLTLIDLGLACPSDEADRLTVGSIGYKDPLLWTDERWAPHHDLFAAWLVLYEVLTGAHPFGGRPDFERPAEVDPGLYPSSYEDQTRTALGDLFRRALGMDADARPSTAQDCIDALREAAGLALPSASQPASGAVSPPAPSQPAAAPVVVSAPAPSHPGALPPEITPDAALATWDLSTRAHSALGRLGVSTAAELVAVERPDLTRLRNVGRKTTEEILALRNAVRDRLPQVRVQPRAVAEAPALVLCAALLADERPLEELGAAMTEGLAENLRELGIFTIGSLSALTDQAALAVPRLGGKRLEKLRAMLRRLSGNESSPQTLDELAELLREELKANYDGVAAVAGFEGEPMSFGQAGTHLGVSRQRVEQMVDLTPLRSDASATAWLTQTVDDLTPRAGFGSVEAVARSLLVRMPTRQGLNPMGFVRLAAVLLQPAQRLKRMRDVELLARPPWDVGAVEQLRAALSETASWPPLERAIAKEALWQAVTDEQRGALRRWEADDEVLLQAVLALCPDIRETRAGELYVPPVLFVDALKQLHNRLPVGVSVDELRVHIDAEIVGVADPIDLDAELAEVGLAQRHGQVVSAIDRPEAPPVSVKIDPSLPRQTVGPKGEIDVSVLVAAAGQGGFRVAALPPRRHHILCERLGDALVASLGPERVRFVDVDRVLLASLEEADLWDDARFYEKKSEARWGWAHRELIAGLERAVFGEGAAKPGVATVLGRPSLLGTLELMPWLSGLYDRARRGKDGLIVLAVPGGIHDGRVRLNEEHNLAYTPDMAALVLRSDDRAA